MFQIGVRILFSTQVCSSVHTDANKQFTTEHNKTVQRRFVIRIRYKLLAIIYIILYNINIIYTYNV